MTNTKLPTYPGEGSSHHIVQQIFLFFLNFFFYDFFLDDFVFVFFLFFFCFFFVFFLQKGGLTCVILAPRPTAFMGTNRTIVGITTNRTQDLSLKGDMSIQSLRHTRNW